MDEIVGCHHRELGQTSGDGEGQRGLMCYSPLGSQRVGHSWATEQQQQQVNNDKLYIHTHVHIQTHTHTLHPSGKMSVPVNSNKLYKHTQEK